MDWNTFENEIEIKEEQEDEEEIEEEEESCFRCQQCDNRFENESIFKMHLRLHNSETEYKKCSFCGQLFKHKQFKLHIAHCSLNKIHFTSTQTKKSQQNMKAEIRNPQTTMKKLFCYECQKYFPDIQSFQNHHQHEKEQETSAQSKGSQNNNYDDNVISEHDYCIKREEADFSDEFEEDQGPKTIRESQTIPSYKTATAASNLSGSSTKNISSASGMTNNSGAEMKNVVFQNLPVALLIPNPLVKHSRNSSHNVNILPFAANKNIISSTNNANVINSKNNNITAASDTKQVLANVLSSMNVNLSDLRDYFRCYKCNASFYKLFDLIPHFQQCHAQPNYTSKTPWRFNQCQKSTQTLQITSTKSTSTQEDEEMDKENTNISLCFDFEEIFPMEIDPLTCSTSAEKSKEPNEEITNENEHSPANSSSNSNLRCFKCGQSPFPNFEVLKQHYRNSHFMNGSWICTTCGAYFQYATELTRHVIQHKQVRPIMKIDPENPDCNKFLTKPWKPSLEYLEAIKNDEEEKGNFTCIICNRFHHLRDRLYRHALGHTRHKVPKCLFCNFFRSNQREINLHMMKKHPDKFPGFICKRCDDKPAFSSGELLKEHREEKHPIVKGPFICHLCGVTFIASNTLTEHLNAHEGIRPFKCRFPNCERSYPSKHRLSQHEITGHSKRYKCPEEGCDQAFRNNSLLTYHKNEVHLGITPFKCSYPNCNESFSSAIKKNHHFKVHQDRRFKCEVEGCGAVFKNRSTLRKHGLSKHSERNTQIEKLRCTYPDCDYKGTEFLLRLHIRNVHEKVIRFLCNECGFRSSNKTTYRKHLLVHSDLRPFKCDFNSCELTFKSKANLRTHQKRKHTDERPLKCQFCDKSFKQTCVLMRHELTHTKFKPYKCAFCEMAYPDNRVLKHHVAKEHSEQHDFNLNVPSTYQVYLRKSKRKHYTHEENSNFNSNTKYS